MLHFAPALFVLPAMSQSAGGTGAEWFWSPDTPACSVRQPIAAEAMVLVVSRTPGTEQTMISLEGSVQSPSSHGRVDQLPNAKITFEPGGPVQAEVWTTIDGSGRRIVSANSEDPEFMSRFSAASAVGFSDEKFGSRRVSLRSPDAAARALRSCEDSKMRKWDIDPVAWRALATRPVLLRTGSPLLNSGDYPRKAMKYGLQGWVVARLDVGPDGAVKDCQSLHRDLYRGFRDTVCSAVKKRARFKPARDSSGNAVAAPYVIIVRFQAS